MPTTLFKFLWDFLKQPYVLLFSQANGRLDIAVAALATVIATMFAATMASRWSGDISAGWIFVLLPVCLIVHYKRYWKQKKG